MCYIGDVSQYAAFLRGMNLGGRRITNPELCASFEALGFTDVFAFLASGNVVFDGKGGPSRIGRALERGLQKQLGYPVPTFIRTAKQVRAVAQKNPFQGRSGADKRGKLQVVFLPREPSVSDVNALLEFATPDDWLAVDGRELFWLPKAGLADSKIDMKGVERVLGSYTVRTKQTVVRLAAKYFVSTS